MEETDHESTFRTPFETYTLVRQVGQGASGYVWSARDEDGNTVAIKYLDPDKLVGTRGKRFRNEIRFGQRTNHPNIVPVLDVGETIVRGQSVPFFVMPIFALTLREAMKRGIASKKVVALFDKILVESPPQ